DAFNPIHPTASRRRDAAPERHPEVTDPIDILPQLRDKRPDDLAADKTPEELRGMTPDDMQRFVDVLDAHLRSIHQTDEGELRDKTPAEQTAFTYGLKLRDI